MRHPHPRSSQPCKRRDLSDLSHRHLRPTWHRAITVLVLTILGLSLSGCDSLWELIHTDGGDAEAQIFVSDEQRVRTFVIETNSFSIETLNAEDQSPSVVVSDNVTEYTMSSNGIVRFNESDGTDQRFDVESGDRIIERPGAGGTGTLTIIDASPTT